MASSQQRITKCGASTQARKETSVLKATVQIKNHLPAPFAVTMRSQETIIIPTSREQKKAHNFLLHTKVCELE